MDKEIDELNKKFEELYKPLDQKRQELVNGLRDPTPEELSKMSEFEKALPEKEKPELPIEELKTAKGIPGFWLKAMENSCEIKALIKDHDKPILKHLTNIKAEILEDNVKILRHY
jgi:nucleosome assembly protein 1-like 1